MFAYSSGSIFPNNISTSGDNYWVDVVFNDGINSPQANNDSGFVATENTAISIAASALLANDTDPNGLPLSITGVSNPIDGTVTYNASTQTVTFVPSTAGIASFVYTVTDGVGGPSSASVSITVNNPPTAQTLFSASDTPANVTVSENSSVELGVKFQALTSGTITGIRFYKGPQNTGPHVADLWTATGTLLASATFTNESASGWQQVNFSSPVVDYRGHDVRRILPHQRQLLGGWQLLRYGAYQRLTDGACQQYERRRWRLCLWQRHHLSRPTASAPPTTGSTSFSKDPPLQPPVANNDSGFFAGENTALSIPASALLANDTDPNGLPLSIAGVSNPSNGTVTYNSSTQTVSFVPTTGYTGPAGFTYSITDGRTGTASANVSLTVTPPPPVANNDSGFVATENTALSIPASALLANDTDPNGSPLSIPGVSNPIDGTVSYNASTQTVSFVPSTAGTASFTYSVTDALGGVASANVSITVNNPPTAQTLFSTSDTPATVTVSDTTRWSLASSSRRPRMARSRGSVSTRARRTRAPMSRIYGRLQALCLPAPLLPTRARVAGSRSTSPVLSRLPRARPISHPTIPAVTTRRITTTSLRRIPAAH